MIYQLLFTIIFLFLLTIDPSLTLSFLEKKIGRIKWNISDKFYCYLDISKHHFDKSYLQKVNRILCIFYFNIVFHRFQLNMMLLNGVVHLIHDQIWWTKTKHDHVFLHMTSYFINGFYIEWLIKCFFLTGFNKI